MIHARHVYHRTMLYNKNADVDPLRISTGDRQYSPRAKPSKISWMPLTSTWLKWNINAY